MACSTMFENTIFYYKKINCMQVENHEVIVKHVRRKFSVRKVVIGQFFNTSQSEIKWIEF